MVATGKQRGLQCPSLLLGRLALARNMQQLRFLVFLRSAIRRADACAQSLCILLPRLHQHACGHGAVVDAVNQDKAARIAVGGVGVKRDIAV